MSQQLDHFDFSAGWIPSDDAVNGRKNGLLAMDNLELDKNGALQLIGGTNVVQSGYSFNAHTLFSRLFGSTRHDYLADTNGGIFRDTTSIGTGGDATNAAFCNAFDFVLACSGNTRKKDNGSTAVNLGVTVPAAAPTFTSNNTITQATKFDLSTYHGTVTGSGFTFGSGYYSASYSSGVIAVQTHTDAAAPINWNAFSDSSNPTDADGIVIQGYGFNPLTDTVEIQLLLEDGDAGGDQTNNYYDWLSNTSDQTQFIYYNKATTSPSTTSAFLLYLPRTVFVKIGTNTKDWGSIYGIRIVFKSATGTTVHWAFGYVAAGALTYGQYLSMIGGSNAQNGKYIIAQVNVNNTGTYQAKSPLGPQSAPMEADLSQLTIGYDVPADSQVNEVWIYAQSTRDSNLFGATSTLNKWYRVAKILKGGGFSGATTIATSDVNAITANLTYNINLTTIASSGISDKILDIIGPMNGRWYYFTQRFMYPSDINNPDLVDTSKAVTLTGATSEIFYWARKVNSNTILVGTSVDIYALIGTFQTYPDGSIDAQYNPLGCKYPPITYDAAVYAGYVYYLGSDGWRSINFINQNENITVPNTDRLYKGQSCYGYTAPSLTAGTRFPISIAKNKIWCIITGTSRGEVWDFNRKYWRVYKYGSLGDATAQCATPDGKVLAFYSGDKKLREIDYQSDYRIDGTTFQTIQALFPIQNGGYGSGIAQGRKDLYTFKFTGNSNGQNLTAAMGTDGGAVANISTTISTSTDSAVALQDISSLGVVKSYQIKISNQLSANSNVTIQCLSVVVDIRPLQQTFLRILAQNFGTAAKKRIRVLPLVIDTLGNNVTFKPFIDLVAGSTSTINTAGKQTVRMLFKTDIQPVDLGFELSGGPFEFFEALPPDIVQTFPLSRQFDQIGPQELFRYGKIKQIEYRVLPLGTSIPYKFYFNDVADPFTGNFTVVNGLEASYFLGMPKGTAGQIVRIEFGPTSFDFMRFYVRLLVSLHGKDTENTWITLPLSYTDSIQQYNPETGR